MALVPISQLKTIFSGVSTFRFADTVQDTLAAAAWDFELPIANDTFNLTQADGTLNATNVFGSGAAWCVIGEAGDVTLDFFIPSVDDQLLGIFYTKTASELVSASEIRNGVTGTYEGYGYHLTNKMITGSAMIISEDGTKALLLRSIQGYPAIKFDDVLNTPMGVTLSLQVLGGNTESDMALLEWTPIP